MAGECPGTAEQGAALNPGHAAAAPTGAARADLEIVLDAVETRLAALATALQARDVAAIDIHAAELHCALARAVSHFAAAARNGGAPPALRRRLASASGLVAAQRESLARATAALDRAIDVLMPTATGTLYTADGAAQRARRSGVVQA